MRSYLTVCLIATAALFSLPQDSYAQRVEDGPAFGILLEPRGETRTPGHKAKKRRRFQDVWMALHPSGEDPRVMQSMKPKEKEPPSGIGKVGGIGEVPAPVDENAASQTTPATPAPAVGTLGGGVSAGQTPDVALSPEDSNSYDSAPQNAGGIGAVGGVMTSPANTTQEEQDTGAPSSAIGGVGGIIGGVGAPQPNDNKSPAKSGKKKAPAPSGGIGNVGGGIGKVGGVNR
jgi:hypothetical protein